MGGFSTLSLGLLVVVVLSLSGAQGCCPQDWLSNVAFCYKVFDETKTWEDAEMFCRKHKPGCHLASIHSKAERDGLATYISNYLKKKDHIWIGLNDPQKKRTWEWSDRTLTNYLSWNPKEPNNYKKNEHCVHLWAPSGYKKWNDTDCKKVRPFVCKCRF